MTTPDPATAAALNRMVNATGARLPDKPATASDQPGDVAAALNRMTAATGTTPAPKH